MADSMLLAQVIGITALVKGVAVLVRPKFVRGILKDLFDNHALFYFLITTELVIGLFLVLTHNIWENSYVVIITILGWLMVIESILFLLLSENITSKVVKKLDNDSMYRFGAALSLIIGAYLIYAGFGL